jgi:hypothetical protein
MLIPTKRLITALAVVLTAGGALAQAQPDLAKKISFSSKAAPASVVLAELAKEAGIALETSPQTGHQVLLLHFKDAPLGEVLDRIAKAAGAEWKQEAAGLRLVLPALLERAQVQKEAEARRNWLNGSLEQQANRLKGTSFNPEEAKRAAEANERVIESIRRGEVGRIDFNMHQAGQPASRALIQLATAVGVTRLAQVPVGQRVVFATAPTRMQVALPANTQAIFREFIQNQIAAVEATKPAQQAAGAENEVRVLMGSGMANSGQGDPKLGVGKALLICRANQSSVTLELLVVDPNGQTIATSMLTLTESVQQSGDAGSDTPKPISFSKLSAELGRAVAAPGRPAGPAVEVMSSGGATRVGVVQMSASVGSGGAVMAMPASGVGGVKLSDELRAQLLQPERYDPLSYGASDALLALAAERQTNLAAWLPDRAFFHANMFASSGATIESLESALQNQWMMESSKEGTWLVLTPRNQTTERRNQVDRKELGRLVRTIETKKSLTLDDAASYALQRGPTQLSQLDVDFSVISLIVRSGGPISGDGHLNLFRSEQWQTFRLYGALSPQQRQGLFNGGKLSLGNMSPAQHAIVHDMVYNSFGGVNVATQRSADPITAIRGAPMMNVMGGGGIQNERTEVLPAGVPRNGFLEVQVARQDGYYASNKATGTGQVVTAETLAVQRAQAEHPQLGQFMQGAQFDEFRPATRFQYTFDFSFTENVKMARMLAEDSIDQRARVLAYESLPAEFRRVVEDRYEQMKKALANVNIANPRGNTRPPQP